MRKLVVRALVVASAALALATTMTLSSAHADVKPGEVDPVFGPPDHGTVSVLVTKLTHSQATSRLRDANITWSSSGNCSDRNNPTCTSFSQVNLATIQGAVTLKQASNCNLNITGGTETGHASGTYSHWNGYKLDYSLSTCLNNWVQNAYTYIGGSKWEAPSGNIYYRESNHWDVTYYNCGGC